MLFTTNTETTDTKIETLSDAREAAADLRWFITKTLGENHPAHGHLKKMLEALNADEAKIFSALAAAKS